MNLTMTPAEARVLRAVAVAQPALPTEIMDLARLGNARFTPLMARLKMLRFITEHKEAVGTSEDRPPKWVYRLSESGTQALVEELALPPVSSKELRPGRTYYLQVTPVRYHQPD